MGIDILKRKKRESVVALNPIRIRVKEVPTFYYENRKGVRPDGKSTKSLRLQIKIFRYNTPVFVAK